MSPERHRSTSTVAPAARRGELMANAPRQTLGVPRDEFLAHVRRSLGKTEKASPKDPHHPLTESVADLEARVANARQRLVEERPALVEKFAETAVLRSWNLFRTSSTEEAIGYIVELARKNEVGQIVRSDQPALAELPLEAVLQGAGINSVIVRQDEHKSAQFLREQIVASGIGITGADYAVAETGSVVVMPRQGLSRLVSLVPPVHVAVVRAEDVVADLDDVFLFRRMEFHRNGREMGSYLNFITGPSRTADIEMKLVVGVHGPREVHLVLLD